MKNLIYLFTFLFINTNFSQEKTSYTPFPKKEVTFLYENCSGLEVTFYEGSSTVSMSGNENTKFLAAGLDSVSPQQLNTKNDAYIMIIANDDFYMDAELSYGEYKYLILKKDGKTYYNKLNEQGEYFFKQILGK